MDRRQRCAASATDGHCSQWAVGLASQSGKKMFCDPARDACGCEGGSQAQSEAKRHLTPPLRAPLNESFPYRWLSDWRLGSSF